MSKIQILIRRIEDLENPGTSLVYRATIEKFKKNRWKLYTYLTEIMQSVILSLGLRFESLKFPVICFYSTVFGKQKLVAKSK